MKTTFDGQERSLLLEVRLDLPELSFGEAHNTADNGTLKILVNAKIAKKDTGFVYTAQAVELQGPAAHNKDEALQCVKDRALIYIGARTRSTVNVEPTTAAVLGPCETLFPKVELASYESGLMKSLMAKIFAGIVPSQQVQYAGWDQVLAKLALEILASGKSIRTELDPESKTRIVGQVANHLEVLKDELTRTRNLEASKDTVLQMGLGWAFSGQQVNAAHIAQILQAVDNSVVPFKVSSERLLHALESEPNGHEALLRFAQQIDATYKAEGLKALAVAEELNYSSFSHDVFNRVIQEQIPVERLREWSSQLAAIKTEISKFSKIGSLKGELVEISIKALKSGEATQQDLNVLYTAIDNSIEPFSESAKTLLSEVRSAYSTQREAIEFARSLTPEYKQLALAIRANSAAVDFESWGKSFFTTILQKRPTLELVRALNATWVGAVGFTQREKARTAGEFGSMNDYYRKKLVERAAEEVWDNADFTSTLTDKFLAGLTETSSPVGI